MVRAAILEVTGLMVVYGCAGDLYGLIDGIWLCRRDTKLNKQMPPRPRIFTM